MQQNTEPFLYYLGMCIKSIAARSSPPQYKSVFFLICHKIDEMLPVVLSFLLFSQKKMTITDESLLGEMPKQIMHNDNSV